MRFYFYFITICSKILRSLCWDLRAHLTTEFPAGHQMELPITSQCYENNLFADEINVILKSRALSWNHNILYENKINLYKYLILWYN